MELGLNKVWHGLKLIKQSVQLVIAHPVLLVYGICSSVIAYALKIAFESSQYSMKSNLSMLMDPQTSGEQLRNFWVTFSYYQIITFVILAFVGLFFLACLAHHAMHKLQNETHGFKETIRDVIYKLPKLCVWFVFIIVTYHYPFKLIWPLLWIDRPLNTWLILYCVIIPIIVYVTSLVLPILATEETGVIAAFKRSYHLVSKFFMVFITIFLFFNVLIFACKFANLNFFNPYIPYGTLLIFVRHLEILTYTIFYYEYYARPKPELNDIFS